MLLIFIVRAVEPKQTQARVPILLLREECLLDVFCVDVAGDEVGVAEHSLGERDRGLHSFDDELVECSQHCLDREFARWAVDDQLADHRVVVRRDAVAFVDVRVDAHSGAAGESQFRDRTRTASKIVVWVFGVDADFDGVAAALDVFLLPRQRFTGGDSDLSLDQIGVGDQFGDGVLDLDAGVDFDEVEIVVLIDDELAGAGVRVVRGLRESHGGIADFFADGFRQVRAGRFLDQLLVLALHRAIAFPQVDDVAVRVGDELHLDVPRVLDVLLHVHAGVLERLLGFLSRLLQAADEFRFLASDSHPLAAAAGRGLDENRIADFLGGLERGLVVGDESLAAGDGRDFGFHRGRASRHFIAEPRHRLVAGADEHDLALLADLGEVRVLGEKPVARMNRLSAADLARADDPLDLQIALGRRRRPDAIRLVGQRQVMRPAIPLAKHSHGLNAELLARADDS